MGDGYKSRRRSNTSHRGWVRNRAADKKEDACCVAAQVPQAQKDDAAVKATISQDQTAMTKSREHTKLVGQHLPTSRCALLC